MTFDNYNDFVWSDGKLNSTSITITRTKKHKPHPSDDELRFGSSFTDHMFCMDYNESNGWHDPRIVPYQPLILDPATAVLHYAQSVFDGLKVYRCQDGIIRFFRATKHAERLNRSCKYLCIPTIDSEMIIQSFHALVSIDQTWIPSKRGTALYLRPTVIASEAFLGVHSAKTYTYFLILSPVGSYYEEGISPVKIMATDTYVRAVKGGLGAAKTAANYAASIFASEDAKKFGCNQVLWLDGIEHRYLDEIGTMNVMMKIKDEIITPPLNGAILDGVTRDSILTLCRDLGIKVSERRISIEEVMTAAHSGALNEMWGTGTAVVVLSIGELRYKNDKVIINGGKPGAFMQKLYDMIVSIQYGDIKDCHNWMSVLQTLK
ncbi:MAG: branched-chain amino acid aminotransferase [Rhodospirillaceae bacterium]|jgi:branched-chain amino acid aminotransferase|nr:branched-chain amino acid aminotransferase [Rhodospirillaceae bacterium]